MGNTNFSELDLIHDYLFLWILLLFKSFKSFLLQDIIHHNKFKCTQNYLCYWLSLYVTPLPHRINRDLRQQKAFKRTLQPDIEIRLSLTPLEWRFACNYNEGRTSLCKTLKLIKGWFTGAICFIRFFYTVVLKTNNLRISEFARNCLQLFLLCPCQFFMVND